MKEKVENHEPQAVLLWQSMEQREQGDVLWLVSESYDIRFWNKRNSQILAVKLKHNDKYLNQPRVNG